jgi:hypothetical protein
MVTVPWLVEFPGLSLPVLGLVVFTGLSLLISRDWRWLVGALALQYLGVFVIVQLTWPLEISVVKLVAGWMAGAIVGMAASNSPASWQVEEQSVPPSRIFRLLAAGLVGLAVASLAEPLQSWLPQDAPLGFVLPGLVLLGLGLLNLGLSTQPLRTVVGLLTAMAGFEILYAGVETSILVAGLLAGVNIGLALAAAYLLLAPGMERDN